MNDGWIVLCILAAIVLLDVTAIRFGYDSRDGSQTGERSGLFPQQPDVDAGGLRGPGADSHILNQTGPGNARRSNVDYGHELKSVLQLTPGIDETTTLKPQTSH
jgi:hypothetical protein